MFPKVKPPLQAELELWSQVQGPWDRGHSSPSPASGQVQRHSEVGKQPCCLPAPPAGPAAGQPCLPGRAAGKPELRAVK